MFSPSFDFSGRMGKSLGKKSQRKKRRKWGEGVGGVVNKEI